MSVTAFRSRAGLIALAILVSAPCFAQDSGALDQSEPDQASYEPPQNDLPQSAAGQAGLRQTRDQLARDAGLQPLARIDSRVRNRLQSRIQNRIDPAYNAPANATSVIEVADEQARIAGQAPPR